ncbi:hypothetical protein ABAC460_01765 [Asticcacaulis sp. AC460]|uniref:hypothetical protein n=1 Tax=Asticcacaulis sp. AC460 TaxID=1282360 RepID=UPI0003C3BA1F|nr:hypothetical protein [Asticcacaulis sp. AC460]ESQ93004.1 hypothetical protein ABAC460_01765 [Asticcacaulis sp. AC460]
MKAIVTFAAMTALLVLTGCDDGPKAVAKGKPWTGAPLPVHEIGIELDDAATKALDAADDKLRITVKYYGLPTAQSASKANALHELEMGVESYVIDRKAKSFTIKGDGVDVTLLPDTADGQIQYKANAIGTSQSNLFHDIIDCSIPRGVLTQPQAAPKVMTCTIKKP